MTSGSAASTASTFSAAALIVSSRVPAGSSCLMVSELSSLTEPRKSVFNSVEAPRVPTKITRAIASVITG